MRIRDYQYINGLETGLTYEENIINYFNIDKSLTIQEIKDVIAEKLTIKQKKVRKYFWFKGKIWRVETDLLSLSYEQFSRLDIILAEGDNISNLHKMLSIYVRPLFRKYSIKTQEKYYNLLLDLDMERTQSIVSLFFSLATRYLSNITVHYLNQMKMREQEFMINK